MAQQAGVGVGTVHRRFPTKESLLAAAPEEHLERHAAAPVLLTMISEVAHHSQQIRPETYTRSSSTAYAPRRRRAIWARPRPVPMSTRCCGNGCPVSNDGADLGRVVSVRPNVVSAAPEAPGVPPVRPCDPARGATPSTPTRHPPTGSGERRCARVS
ncbi:TetR/AcrR family transcriptional regulator [Micromonospora wenchangensis]|uniref:TetR/AcrR family transcriptional regulator n=1 Tax=Micromonospora wenchangensis TaxID=1185415 RepID=UPI003809375E